MNLLLDFSIIIPTKNRKAILNQTLQYALIATKGYSVEFLIINDGEEAIETTDSKNIRIFKNPGSGVASARNLGARLAVSDNLIFMDDDMWMQESNLKTLQIAIAAHPNSCINLNWIYPPSLTKQLENQKFGRYLKFFGFTSLKGWNKGEHWDDEKTFETNGLTSQFLYLPRAVFNLVSGYNEKFPHAGFEDYDLAYRLKLQGVKFYICPESLLYHNEEDRVIVKNWLARKKRGGETRKFAVLAGYKKLELHYSWIKTITYTLCIWTYPVLFWMESVFPNNKKLDKLYFRFVNLLLGAHSFEGYQKTES